MSPIHTGWLVGSERPPYFEDTLVKNSPTSASNARNRLEVGIPYKKLLDRKAGQPSLIRTTEEDEDKQLTVEKFVVQQYRDERTGGLQTVGRALVKDHKLGGDAFEINNKMTEVFAGNIKIEVRMTIEELDGKTFLLLPKMKEFRLISVIECIL